MSLGLLAACMGVMFLVRGALSGSHSGSTSAAGWWRSSFVCGGRRRGLSRGSVWVLLAGVGAWAYCSGTSPVFLTATQLFHLARTRKLLDLGNLSLGSVNEFADGSLHPGYAFPLWHGLTGRHRQDRRSRSERRRAARAERPGAGGAARCLRGRLGGLPLAAAGARLGDRPGRAGGGRARLRRHLRLARATRDGRAATCSRRW